MCSDQKNVLILPIGKLQDEHSSQEDRKPKAVLQSPFYIHWTVVLGSTTVHII